MCVCVLLLFWCVCVCVCVFVCVCVGGDIAQLVEHRTGTQPTQVRFPGAARDFFSPRIFYGVPIPPCAIACIYISAHVKDPVVHVFSGLWKRSNTKHAPYVGKRNSVAAGFPRGRQPEFPMGEIPLWQYSCRKSKVCVLRVFWVCVLFYARSGMISRAEDRKC